ncbi:MAG: hypothetical protein B6D56_01450 [Candidatus Omnitrophica bacterium 4484_70.1]|nr:MAG: hypothetical protein B6D56_01450 [Candidatus Omnitrophica bacterium 4484_70.1]
MKSIKLIVELIISFMIATGFAATFARNSLKEYKTIIPQSPGTFLYNLQKALNKEENNLQDTTVLEERVLKSKNVSVEGKGNIRLYSEVKTIKDRKDTLYEAKLQTGDTNKLLSLFSLSNSTISVKEKDNQKSTINQKPIIQCEVGDSLYTGKLAVLLRSLGFVAEEYKLENFIYVPLKKGVCRTCFGAKGTKGYFWYCVDNYKF